MSGKFQSGNKGYGRPRTDDPGSFSSAESLDEYIRVSNPGTKIVLAALLVVLAGVIIWGTIGKLPIAETVKGFVLDKAFAEAYYNGEKEEVYKKSGGAYVKSVDGEEVIYCFIDASKYNLTQVRNFNQQVSIELPDHRRITGTIAGDPISPLTPDECFDILFESDWVAERCVTSDYSWLLVINPDEDLKDYEFIIADVTIVTDEVTPISFIAK